LPESLLRIGQGAFSQCGELTAINLPESLTEIGDGAFISCDKLAVVTVLRGSYAHTWAKQNGLPVKVIGFEAFRKKTKLFPEYSLIINHSRCSVFTDQIVNIHSPDN
jgi:hypothetical protein